MLVVNYCIHRYLPNISSRCDAVLNSVQFEVQSISNALQKLKPTPSCGMGCISNIFLKTIVNNTTLQV